MGNTNYSEHELLVRLSSGDPDAFSTIFNTYWDKLYSTAHIILKSSDHAEDFVQEVFLRLWKDRSRAAEIDHLENFLFIVARNLIYNRLKKLKREEAYRNYLKYNLEGTGNKNEGTPSEFHELRKIVAEGINLLPPQQQRAFRLSREQGLTHIQIANEMNISRDSVKDYIVRSLAFLRKHLRENIELLSFMLSIYPFF